MKPFWKIAFLPFIIFSCLDSKAPVEKLNYHLPEFQAVSVLSKKELTKTTILQANYKKIYLHFWGTWCAPCEAEFPDFVSFARKLEKENILFLAIAVNDQEGKVNKYLKKFGKLPKKFDVFIEKDKFSVKLGTNKLPETFLIKGNGDFLEKYIGPQKWNSSIYYDHALK